MKILFILVTSALFVSSAYAHSIAENTLVFTYEPNDGSPRVVCKADKPSKDNPYDRNVTCPNNIDPTGKPKTYVVHLSLDRNPHPNTAPGTAKVSYELLYWVDGNGASSIFDFKDNSTMMSFDSSQSLTGEDAALRLQLKLN